MNISTDKWLLTIYPNKTYTSMFMGGVFGADESNQYIEFDTEEEMLKFIKDHNMEICNETE